MCTAHRLPSVGLIGLLCLTGAGCGNNAALEPWADIGTGKPTSKPRVLCSIAPLHCFAVNVAGDDAEVRCLLTARGPHDYQSTPHDAKLLSTADLFIVNGMGLEDFLASLVRSAGNSRLKVCRTGERLPKNSIIEASGVGHFHGDQWVVHTGSDPHVWLGIEEAKRQVEAIRDALIELDAAHAEGYRSRATAYLAKLDALKAEYRGIDVPGGLVSFHDSFRYFGRSFNVKIVGTIRDLVGSEVAPSKLTEQAEEFRKAGVKLISVEPQYPRRVAENLAREIGPDVKLVELDPIETGPVKSGRSYYVDPDWYMARMRTNLENLKQASSRAR